jgi:hypothetical protein
VLLQVDNDLRVSRNVVDPVARPIGPWHAADEEQAILVVEDDLDRPGLPVRRRVVVRSITWL